MNRLRLLKRLNAEGLLDDLSGDELRLFLLMIANCRDNGEGELHGDAISRIFGRDFTKKQLDNLCTELKKLRATSSCFRSCAKHGGLVMTYRILFTE